MTESRSFDVALIGGGPAGYVGAIRASQLGLSACVVEMDKPGGVCLNIGCIPSKALIHQAESFLDIKNLEAMGVKVDTSGFDYGTVFRKSRKAADSLSKGVNFLLKKNKVELFTGRGRITGKNEVTIDGKTTISAKHIVVATGSRPIELPPFPFDEETVLSSTGALMLEELPKSLLILGGGVIGCEFAHILSAFGTEVTIVEMLDRILPMEDPETGEVLARSFKKRKIRMLTGTKAVSLEKKDDGVELTVENDGVTTVQKAQKLLVVVGRRPNTEDIGLDDLGIEVERGFVPVGDYGETKVSGIYAVGDVTSSPLLAHVASKESEIAVEHIAGKNPPPRIDPDMIPSAVYTDPQIAGFGMKEETAKASGRAFETVSFPYRGAGKSVAIEKPDGLVKIIFDPETKEILGAHLAGAEATELVHEILLAKASELLPEDIATMIHAHPTLSEAVMEAARAAEGWAIHV
jgi:dihydrolipoamide dehydrogenase